MYELSASIELLFTEHSGAGEGSADPAHRIARAAAAGIPAVEIWTWRDKDLGRLARALTGNGVALQTMCVQPMGVLVDPSTHATFLTALAESAAAADRLGCPFLVVTAGDALPGVPRTEQHHAIVSALRGAARVLAPYQVTLLLENLNSRADHVGTFLDATSECLDILGEVASPRVRLLYDLYHSLVMGERPESVLKDRAHLLAHVQIADVPGRHEPGTGTVDWRHELSVLRGLGYTGRIGLEFVPATDTASSLQHIRALARPA